jgi:hypothetical protein
MTSPPPYRITWIVGVVVTTAIAAATAASAINFLKYGPTLFLSVPFFIGFFPTLILRQSGPQPFSRCWRVAMTVALVFSLGFLVLRVEGLICLAMALPIASPLIVFGAYIGYVLVHQSSRVSPPAAALVVVLGLGASLFAEMLPREAPTFTVTDAVDIAAPPATVWNALINLGSLGQPQDWLFRLGVACPQRVDIYGTGVGAHRVCTLTTGQLDEQITEWQPNRRLQWVSISTPAPMKELNPFGETNPPHLHGFYRSVSGQFEFQAIGRDSTRVTRSSSYQHNMYPARYWQLWCDYVARRGHVYVLGVLKESAERRAALRAAAR